MSSAHTHSGGQGDPLGMALGIAMAAPQASLQADRQPPADHSEGALPSAPPQDRSQKRFILTALRTLLTFDPDSQAVMVELMASYLQAPNSTR